MIKLNQYFFVLSIYRLINSVRQLLAIAEIATAIATRITITPRRDVGGRLAALNRSLLPVMKSHSLTFLCYLFSPKALKKLFEEQP